MMHTKANPTRPLKLPAVDTKSWESIPARALVLTLLSVFPDRNISVRALLAAGELFDISERGVRVALGRLSADGKVSNLSRGQYNFGAGAESVRREVADWRSTESRIVDWTGGWIGVLEGGMGRSDRTALRRHDRALRLRGFRELVPALSVRPDNLRGGVSRVRTDLQSLGLNPAATVLSISDLDNKLSERARSLWDVAELNTSYREFTCLLDDSKQRLKLASRENALTETLSIGRRVVRHILLDPLLPKPLVQAAARQKLIARMLEYHRLGHDIWSEFLDAHP